MLSSSPKRYVIPAIEEDLRHKMVFLAGPRQVGKTTVARALIDKGSGYLNWDLVAHREQILKHQLPESDFWAFDELHKYRHWRNFLKGLWDEFAGKKRVLVTGSARLEYFRRGGDSLQGRYHLHRLHPLSFAEIRGETGGDLQSLLTLGGFPEPFFSSSERAAKRWSREYRSRLVREEITDLEQVRDLDRLELLSLRLPELVGSPLSLNALREDLQVAHKTVARWVSLLENLYALFRVPPFGAPKLRAVKKEQKHYHFDWTLVPDQALRFENLVAAHLLKWVHFRQDREGEDLELRYFRDVDGREVDFVLCERRVPKMLVECKWSDGDISKSLRYLHARFPACEAWQVSATGTKDYRSREGIRVAPATAFLANLC